MWRFIILLTCFLAVVKTDLIENGSNEDLSTSYSSKSTTPPPVSDYLPALVIFFFVGTGILIFSYHVSECLTSYFMFYIEYYQEMYDSDLKELGHATQKTVNTVKTKEMIDV